MNLQSHTHRRLLAIFSGLLLYSCYYPLNFGAVVAWFALVPIFLSILNAESRWQTIQYAALTGLFFYVPALQWMRVAHPAMYATWIGLALYCTFHMIVSMVIIRYFLRKGVLLWFIAPLVITLSEYIRSHFPTGFSWLEPLGVRTHIGFGWYHLGYSQRDNSAFIQLADTTGVYGLSWILCLCNSIIALCLYRCRNANPIYAGQKSSLLLATLGAFLVVVGSHLYGINYAIEFAVARKTSAPDEIKMAAVQTNVGQDIKNARGSSMGEQFVELGRKAALLKADLIVWPETSCPDEWPDTADKADRAKLPTESFKRQNQLRKILVDNFGKSLLLGLNGMVRESESTVWKYNSALYLSGDEDQRYDKMHLVPFGEYVPLRTTFPWMKMFTPYENDYSCRPGESWTRFRLKKNDRDYYFGVLICYEDSDASMAREAVARSLEAGQNLNFLVNISNDGWFDGTAEHEEHLSICRFRAIETRRPIVRSVNMGISAFIDADGSYILPGDSLQNSKKIETVLSGTILIDSLAPGWTTYVRWGDWVPGVCALGILAAFCFVSLKRK